ncbi:MAG: CfaE/CblD family pilus tip adhesin [Kluyvera sp.]
MKKLATGLCTRFPALPGRASFFSATVTVLMLITSAAHATRVEPAPRSITIERTFDRMNRPSQSISLWNRESGGYDTDNPPLWGRSSWVCESSSDSTHGKCNTSQVWFDGAGGSTTLPLLFTEQRSGMRVELNLQGYLEKDMHSSAGIASGCGEYGGHYPVHAASYVVCDIVGFDGVALTVNIPASELSKIPVGGVWKAQLHLKLMEWKGVFLADWNAWITLKVIDPDHMDIYFPKFSSAAPLVELNLQPKGAPDGNAWASDYTMLDMCLYDGYNVNSTRYDVLIRDEGASAPGRKNGYFSLYRDGASKGPEADRIDFHLKMKSPQDGSLIDVKNNEGITWDNFNEDYVRPVRLPSIVYPVLCAPAPLAFIVDKFNVMDKTAGHYTGTVTVIFTPTLPTVD